jgi:hypothetical protein
MDFVNGMLFISSVWSVCIWYGPMVFNFLKQKTNNVKAFLALPRPPKLNKDISKHIKPKQMAELSYAEEIANLDDDVKEALNELVVDWENDEIFDREGCIEHVFDLYEDIIEIMENTSLSNREKLKKTEDIKECISTCRELIVKH